jgi:hypothetical protein
MSDSTLDDINTLEYEANVVKIILETRVYRSFSEPTSLSIAGDEVEFTRSHTSILAATSGRLKISFVALSIAAFIFSNVGFSSPDKT